jgi:hypothetical protein
MERSEASNGALAPAAAALEALRHAAGGACGAGCGEGDSATSSFAGDAAACAAPTAPLPPTALRDVHLRCLDKAHGADCCMCAPQRARARGSPARAVVGPASWAYACAPPPRAAG